MEKFLNIFSISLFQNTIRTATPVIIAAMGGLLTEHAGIMNIGMDGMMLIGAFTAVLGSWFLGSAWLGLLIAILVGVLIGLFFGLFVVRLKSDEFIIGVALNIFASALTIFLLRTIFGGKGSFTSTNLSQLPVVHIPLIEDIPILGDLLSGHSFLVYISWLLVLVCWLLVYKTPFGFRLRAAGEKPESLRALGKSPAFMKYMASILCGILCGIAGAHLSLGYLQGFTEDMSANRGFIAYACIIFGRSNPVRVFLAVLLFGFLNALGFRLQDFGISQYLTEMLPYLTTIVVLVIGAIRDKSKKHELLTEQ